MLLSGVAIAAIAVAAPESANAQMYSTGPGFYLSVEGRYVMNDQKRIRDFPFNSLALPITIGTLSTISALKERAGNGWGAKGMLGYRFNNNWDIGVGFSGAWHKTGKGSNSANLNTTFFTATSSGFFINATASQSLKVKLDYHVGDFEAGYNWKMGNSNIRLFGG
ncbi:MAG TPA: Lpg1974 family pore-forming outer membrane protein, partial [Lacipirellulaceae bacterium]|nr:Lpg1974 family pore-forming outer membrane protein [Lacipirellulaceae bacterium]